MSQDFFSKVKGTLDLTQPDGYTCQSTCVAMALGLTDILKVRHELEAIGDPGSAITMGDYLTAHLLPPTTYEFEGNASISQIRDWLKAGEFLIIHGWFTAPGHVIAIDGVEVDPSNLSYKFSVRDPWAEFDFARWSYDINSVGFHGFYSSYGIYAACVVGQSKSDAADTYSRGDLDANRGGAWVHRIKPGVETPLHLGTTPLIP